MALPAPIQAILTRLRGSNNNAYNAGSNPLGMGQGGHRQNFNPRLGDVADLSDWMSSTAEAVDTSAGAAADSASAASGSAGAANTSAGAAAQSVSDAAAQVTLATNQAQRLAGTSTTSNTSTIASKTFTTQADKAFEVGSYVHIQSRGTLNRWMAGRVTAYSGTSLTVAVEAIGTTTSAGTDWDIRIAGARGAQGDQGPQGTNRIIREARTSNTALTVAENAELIDCTGTFTQTFAAASVLGAGWQATIRSNTGTVTLDPNGSETIDGATTLALRAGETRQVICTGTGFVTILVDAPVPAAGLVFISEQTVSAAVASVTFTGLDTTYDEYVIDFLNVVPSTSDATLKLTTSSDGGSTFSTGTSDYANNIVNSNATALSRSVVTAASIEISPSNGLSNLASSGGASGSVRIIRPGSTTEFTQFATDAMSLSSTDTAVITQAISKAARRSAAKTDAVRFFMSAGNISIGSFKLYGLRKS